MNSINTLGPNTPRIALIGECMIELQQRADGTLQQSFGGDTLNTAVYLIRCDGESFEAPAQVVERVVDTTAAGDSFSAAYLACRLKGGSPVEAAAAGHRLASRVIQVPGALIPR